MKLLVPVWVRDRNEILLLFSLKSKRLEWIARPEAAPIKKSPRKFLRLII
jgi:hypothetical protein